MSEENVKVAVRVRPFNQREKDAKSTLVVEMVGNQTMLTKPKGNDEPRKFAFDYSYWSHDGFKTESNGYFSPESSKYCDQKKVFDDLGVGVLNNSWNGFNASLFAYGQTGSGKSYSVVGYSTNKGIVPMVCEEIFKRTAADSSGKIQYEVTFSMLEIYSEVVRDLLNAQGDKKQGLPVREDTKNGFYAQGLRKQLVASYADITKLTDEGNANRTIAATNMNATSSRAHTIISIYLVQKYKNDAGKEMAKSSTINLVDLAGSERADQTGATGDRLKEGAAINLSLTSLGNVIAALADNSSGKSVRVPYRDSVLTKLLQNALGGNSKTIMIAAISPADINYDESLSTLRYADRAKQIKCKAVVNEDPTEKLIKSLQEENAKLKELLKNGGKIDPSLVPQASDPAVQKQLEAELKRVLEENERQMNDMKKSYEERLQDAKKAEQSEASLALEKAKTIPHFSNINMDPSLSNKVKIILEGEGQKKIGIPEKSDIPLNGLGIMDPHAILTIEGGKYFVERCDQSRVLVNGKPITTKVQINHMDRVVFGTSQYFLFIEPSKKTAKDPFVTFEMAQDEIAKESGLLSNTKNMTKEEIQCQGELVDLIPQVEEANSISIVLDKKVKFEALVVSAAARGDFGGKMKPYVHMKNFATGLEWMWEKTKFLDRKILMSEYYSDFKDDGFINSEKFTKSQGGQQQPTAAAKQKGKKQDNLIEFDMSALTKGDLKNAVKIGTLGNMDLFDDGKGKKKSDDKSKKTDGQGASRVAAEDLDPFYESPDTATQIGTAGIFPKCFAYMFASKEDYKIMDFFGKQAGTINLEILPCDASGKILTEKDGIVINNPEKDLLDKNVNFVIKINNIRGLHEKYEDIYCQFNIFNDPNLIVTETVRGTNNPDFKFSKQFSFTVTKEFLDNLMNKCFFVQVWGEQKHPKPDAMNKSLSTKEYFDKEKELHGNSAVAGTINKSMDLEKTQLKEEITVRAVKEKRLNATIDSIRKLADISEKTKKPISAGVVRAVLSAQSDAAIAKILENYEKNAPESGTGEQQNNSVQSGACNIL